jgi:nucleotide-binding universal stress UspA family protein
MLAMAAVNATLKTLVEENLMERATEIHTTATDLAARHNIVPDTVTEVGKPAREILDYLSRFHYASIKHALIALFWETGMRLGAAQLLDVTDQ